MSVSPYAPSFRDRLNWLSVREKRFILGGGLIALLLIFFFPGQSEIEPGVQLSERAVPAASLPPAPMPAAMPATSPVPSAATASAQGLILKGVFGGGPGDGAAIILFPSGQQRVVPVGRDVLPGLKVKQVGLTHAIIGSEAGDMRLDMGRATATAVAGGGASSPAHRAPTTASRETMQYRDGLDPYKINGRVGGFSIRPGANIPTLQKAGLRAGDVLVAVNGQAFESEEKVTDLAQEIAGSYTAEFEFIRDGRKQKTSLVVNKRP